MKNRTASGTLSGMLLALALSAGCASDPAVTAHRPDETAPDAWSTKRQSVVGLPTADDRLAVDPGVVDRALHEGLRTDAMGLLAQGVRSTNALIRVNAIEAFQQAPDEAVEAVRLSLGDENRAVRFAAAMTVGQMRLSGIAHLLEPMLTDPSESVQAAAIYGMRMNGIQVDLNPLATLIRSDDPEVRANAAYVLGELGDPSALPMLHYAMGRGLPGVAADRARLVDMQVAEAMVKLGDASALEGIRAGLFAPEEQGEVVALACQMCGRLGDVRATRTLLDLATREGRRQPPAEIRLAATAALARIEPQLAPEMVPMEYVSADTFTVRAQAALALGELGRPSVLPTLAAMMGDANPIVQVSAAAAVLQVDRTIASAGSASGY